jgi:hypothetical protein
MRWSTSYVVLVFQKERQPPLSKQNSKQNNTNKYSEHIVVAVAEARGEETKHGALHAPVLALVVDIPSNGNLGEFVSGPHGTSIARVPTVVIRERIDDSLLLIIILTYCRTAQHVQKQDDWQVACTRVTFSVCNSWTWGNSHQKATCLHVQINLGVRRDVRLWLVPSKVGEVGGLAAGSDDADEYEG